VHSFGRGRIGLRHNKLSDRDRRCSFPGEHEDGSGTDNASGLPSDLHASAPRGGPGETINGRRALVTADEVIE